MIIGEIIETLIRVHNSGSISKMDDDAVCSACNILSKLPRMMDEETAKYTLLKREDAQEQLDNLKKWRERQIEAIRCRIDAGTLTSDDRQLLDELHLPYEYDMRANI